MVVGAKIVRGPIVVHPTWSSEGHQNLWSSRGFLLNWELGHGINEGKGINDMIAGTEGQREVCRQVAYLAI